MEKARKRDPYRAMVLHEIYATTDMSAKEYMGRIREIAKGKDVPI